jgi:hypothetical protein
MSILKSTNIGFSRRLTIDYLFSNNFILYRSGSSSGQYNAMYRFNEFDDKDFRLFIVERHYKYDVYYARVYNDIDAKIKFNDLGTLLLLLKCWRIEYKEYCKSKWMYRTFNFARTETEEMFKAKQELYNHLMNNKPKEYEYT